MDCLQVPLTSLKGVGPKTGEKLSAAGLDTVEDLLRRFAEQAGKKLNNDRILLSTEEGK